MRQLTCDLCVIGAGAAGLAVATDAGRLGLSVVLFERGALGGSRLNASCVPSKALIAAANLAHAIRGAGEFGISLAGPQVHWSRVRGHIREVIGRLAAADIEAELQALQVRVIREAARFADPNTIVSDSTRVEARRIVIATGSKPVIPDVPGIEDISVDTNDTIFNAETAPTKLFILGASPIGLELGQAFQRIDIPVTIIEQSRAIRSADRDAYDLITACMRADGVELLEGWRVTKGMPGDHGGVRLELTHQSGAKQIIAGSHILAASARAANLERLDLKAGGVAFDEDGIRIHADLRSISNRRVWAVGDATGRASLTHIAREHARVFLRNALLKAPTRVSPHVPTVMFTAPELAQIGLTEEEARQRHGPHVRIARANFADCDNAQAARETHGFCKIVVGPRGRILGATIVGADAGETLAPIALAMAKNMRIAALAAPILPYPTRAEIVKRAANAYFAPLFFTARIRDAVRWLQRIP